MAAPSTRTGGTVNLTTSTTDNIRIGNLLSETSGYNLSGGTLNATASDTVVGYDGNGALTVSGGTANIRGIRLGNAVAANHNGSGTVTDHRHRPPQHQGV